MFEIRERRGLTLPELVGPSVVNQPDGHGVEEVQLLPARTPSDDKPRLFEEAGLVVSRKSGRTKQHFLNPVPIRLIYERWIDKYTEHRVSALAELKTKLEAG